MTLGKHAAAPDRPSGVCLLLHRGMDVYNKHFIKNSTDVFHDPFYTQSDILTAFSNYVAEIVKRYANETSVLGTFLLSIISIAVLTSSQGWELANDPRCASSLPTTNSCNPHTITKWTATIAAVVKQNDPNHLVSTGQYFVIWSLMGPSSDGIFLQIGDSGFYCVNCPKLFPYVPPPRTSPVPRQKRRRRGYLTGAELRKLFVKREKRRLGTRGSWDKSQLLQVRGNWYAPRDTGQLPYAHVYSYFTLIAFMQFINASPTPLVQILMGRLASTLRTWPILPALISPLSNTSPIRTHSDRTGPLTPTTSRVSSRMVLIGSTFMPRRQIRESSCTASLLDLTTIS